MKTKKKQWNLTQDSFDKMLHWLDADPGRAGREYEEIRRRLTNIFMRRGCIAAEDLADETINRVGAKIGDLSRDYDGIPRFYFYRVAQIIHMEYLRSSDRKVVTENQETISTKGLLVSDSSTDRRVVIGNQETRAPTPRGARHPRPPFKAEYLLYLLLRSEERTAIIGDLIEEYAQVLNRFNKRHADIWFYKQVAGSLLPFLWQALLRIGALVWLGRILRRLIP